MAKSRAVSDQQRLLLEQYVQRRSEKLRFANNIPRRDAKRMVPLTFAQEQIWAHAQLAPELPVYNEPFTVYREGPLDVGILERSFSEIIRRHESWRTTFSVLDGQPMQIVHPPFEIKLPVFDLRSLPEPERVPVALRLATEDAVQPFNLAKLPLLRARLVRLGGEQYRLFIVCHHLIFDGVTGYQVFLPELIHLCRSFADDQCPGPAPLAFQYGDYAVWERDVVRSDKHERVEYWRKRLAGPLPELRLPEDRPGSGGECFRGAMLSFALSRELSQDLHAMSRQHGVTLFMTLLAALSALLSRYSGQYDILVGSITAGRNVPGTEELLGLFLNTVILRTDLSGDPKFIDLLERVRETTIGALSNEIPLEEALRELRPQRGQNANSLFRVLLSLEPSLGEIEPGWNLTSIDVQTGTTKFDLCLVLDDRPEGLCGRVIYSTDIFDGPTVARLVDCFQTLLQSVVVDREARISSVEILPAAERRKLLVEWNQTAKQFPLIFAHQLFESHAKSNPSLSGVTCGKRELSYGELDQRANQVAGHLRKLGVGPDVPVALCLDRSLEMIIAILGILKAGGAYVPLDPAYPRERLEYMLDNCGASVLLTQEHLPWFRQTDRGVRVLLLDKDWDVIAKESTLAHAADLAPSNLAYIFYTSGSTGVPKGVRVTHRSLAHSTAARIEYYDPSGKKFLLLSSFAFDSSVATIFHPLCSGGHLVLPDSQFNWEASQISNLIFRHQVSNILCVPTVYTGLLQSAESTQLQSLNTVVLAGEPCPGGLVEAHYKKLPSVQLFNEYGPTEATVWSTVYRCQPHESHGSIPIGRPIANTKVYVLDDNLQPMPVGVPGELYIGGEGVASGYIGDTDLTQKKFLPVPFDDSPHARMYRTGDRVRYLADGNLQFIGRTDQQVKIRGMRIELGEIEAALGLHPDVREAAVTIDAEERLLAYVVAAERYATSAGELTAFLKSRLPNHMVPSLFTFLSALPRTANGKVDRAVLSSPRKKSEKAHASVSPRDSIEKRLLQIWKEVLGTQSCDVTQNFFQLGGHSLLAAKLLYRIEQEFHQLLTLAFVFQAPTIELMADWLRSPSHGLRSRTIIEIQPKGLQPPLFWVRAGPRFRLLAEKLGDNQPFLGLDIPYADAIKLATPYHLEDISAFLVRAMREVQPQGPYCLAGLCVNAVIAYEMARQLNQQGEGIALLALFDAHNQAFYKDPLRDGRYTGRLKYHLSNIINSDVREGPAYIGARLNEMRRKLERTVWKLSSNHGPGSRAAKMHNADAVILPAFHRYEPGTYLGDLILFQSSDWPQGDYFNFELGWQDLVGGQIAFHRIPGNHPSMFTQPNVNLVASLLSEYLAKIDDRGKKARGLAQASEPLGSNH
jgi:surfactin family lipopeptide synthetase A